MFFFPSFRVSSVPYLLILETLYLLYSLFSSWKYHCYFLASVNLKFYQVLFVVPYILLYSFGWTFNDFFTLVAQDISIVVYYVLFNILLVPLLFPCSLPWFCIFEFCLVSSLLYFFWYFLVCFWWFWCPSRTVYTVFFLILPVLLTIFYVVWITPSSPLFFVFSSNHVYPFKVIFSFYLIYFYN